MPALTSIEDGTIKDGSDVFLNFRGEDTRNGFTGYLNRDLKNSGVNVYIDAERIRKGEIIDSELFEAINHSKIAITIISRGYSSSDACLKELVEIMKCRRKRNLKVIPVFYKAVPSDLRKPNSAFTAALQSHKKKYDERTIETWKEALKQLSELNGWTVNDNSNESEIVTKIAKEVGQKLHSIRISRMEADDFLVGIDKRAIEVMKNIEDDTKLHIVGIHGVRGVGKTTLAKFIYEQFSKDFAYSSIITDVRQTLSPAEKIEFFQQRISEDFREFVDIFSMINGMKNTRISQKNVLVVLDGVDDTYLMRILMKMCIQFSSGSKILLTTRNNDVVNVPGLTFKYELKTMNVDDSLKLFCKHAFGNDNPPDDLKTHSSEVVKLSGYLPLRLKDFGSLLSGKKEEEWKCTLKIMRDPNFGDGDRHRENLCELLDEKQKQILIDVACFFIGYDKRIAIHMWKDLELSPEETLETLKRLSLVQIDDKNMFQMDDQVKDYARKMANTECTHLWNHEKALLMLKGSKGDQEVLAQYANFDPILEYCLRSDDFRRLPNVRFLHVTSGLQTSDSQQASIRQAISPSDNPKRNDGIFSNIRWLSWHGFPSSLNVTIFAQTNLIILDLSWSKISSTWEGWKHIQMAKKLKVLNLTGCSRLHKTPLFSNLKGLERLILEGCHELVEIDKSIGDLENLIHLNLIGCSKLRHFPPKVANLASLQELLIDNIEKIICNLYDDDVCYLDLWRWNLLNEEANRQLYLF